MAPVPGQNPLNPQASTELLAPEFLPPESMPAPAFGDPTGHDSLADYVSHTVLQVLPNDLTRMIYLASLRDCNSGMYLHPELSHQRGLHAADRALRACHEEVFRRLLTTRLPEYVIQLQEYVRYTRGETPTVLKTWKSLQAYRATVPVDAPATSTELYFLNVTIALEVVGKEMPEELQP
ncbi:MAG: hypothetical protein WBQ64_03020 [Terriglobales bacterium]